MEFVSFEIAKKLEEKGFTQGYNISGCKFVFSNENTIKRISDDYPQEIKEIGNYLQNILEKIKE